MGREPERGGDLGNGRPGDGEQPPGLGEQGLLPVAPGTAAVDRAEADPELGG